MLVFLCVELRIAKYLSSTTHKYSSRSIVTYLSFTKRVMNFFDVKMQEHNVYTNFEKAFDKVCYELRP